jgi:SH3-like domain-containing protein
LFVLPAGTAVRIEHTTGSWAKVVTADGQTGWAYASYFRGAATDGTGHGVANAPSVDSVAAAPVATASVVERQEPLVARGKPPKAFFKASDNRKAKKAKVFRLANDTVLRASPSKGSNKISVAHGGAKLLVTEWDGAWARVILADGTSGWIKAR